MKTKTTIFKIVMDMTTVILVMYFNIWHNSQVYYNVTAEHYPASRLIDLASESKWIMVVLDIAIIGFILNGNKKESAVFTFIIFLLNLIFYNVAYKISITYYTEIDEISSIAACLILSGAYSYLIHRKSISLINLMYGYDNMDQAKAAIQKLEAVNKQKDKILEQKNAEVLTQEAKNIDLEAVNSILSENKSKIEKDLTCSCGFRASTENGLASALKSINAHKGVCNKEGSTMSAMP